MSNALKPRLWISEDPTSLTQVIFSPNPVTVIMGTNIGHLPLGNTPDDPYEAEKFAIGIAENYHLIEDTNFAEEIEMEENNYGEMCKER
jgi:hypothetical protein